VVERVEDAEDGAGGGIGAGGGVELAAQETAEGVDAGVGQDDRLARVRFLTLSPSRNDSRSRIAGGEDLLGITATYITS